MMASRVAPVSSACRVAQRRACFEPSDPSTPTTMRACLSLSDPFIALLTWAPGQVDQGQKLLTGEVDLLQQVASPQVHLVSLPSRRAGARIASARDSRAEFAHNVDHAVDVPGQPDRYRDQVALVIRLSLPGEGHDAVAHAGCDAGRIREQDLAQHLVDLPCDVLVGAQEYAQQVTAAHDPDQRAVRVDHRQPLEVVT